MRLGKIGHTASIYLYRIKTTYILLYKGQPDEINKCIGADDEKSADEWGGPLGGSALLWSVGSAVRLGSARFGSVRVRLKCVHTHRVSARFDE